MMGTEKRRQDGIDVAMLKRLEIFSCISAVINGIETVLR
jgi:hypothetical protein